MARDGKKSFFELEQSTAQGAVSNEKVANTATDDKIETNEDNEKNIVEKSPKKVEEIPSDNSFTKKNENDLNALDYEADKDDNIDESETTITVQRAEVEYKEKSLKSSKHNELNEKSSKKETDSKKTERRRRSRSREKRSREKRSRDKSDRRHSSRNRNDRRVYRRREFSPYRDNRRRDAQRFKRNRSRSVSYDRSRRQRHRDSR